MKKLKASGTIYPSRFVVIATTGNDSVAQATQTGIVMGVSQEYSAKSYIPGYQTDTYAAVEGGGIDIYFNGEIATILLGGEVTEGDWIGSDADGKGIRATGNSWSGGIAEEGGIAGDLIRIRVYPRRVKTARAFSPAFSSAFA